MAVTVIGKQSQLYRGDILRTDARSLIEAQLVSSSRITLSPRSELHIDESASRELATSQVKELLEGKRLRSTEPALGPARKKIRGGQKHRSKSANPDGRHGGGRGGQGTRARGRGNGGGRGGSRNCTTSNYNLELL